MFTPNVACIGVYLNNWFSTFIGWPSRFSSMTRRIPERSLSSRTQAPVATHQAMSPGILACHLAPQNWRVAGAPVVPGAGDRCA